MELLALENKSYAELMALLENIKVSNASLEIKQANILNIEKKLGWVKPFNQEQIYSDIRDGNADIDDIN